MEIKKKKQTFNTYVCEISYGQLTAIRNALSAEHADPLADELYAELNWYLENIPGPGEDEETLKAEEEAAASGLASPEAAQKPLNPRADDLLPAPGAEEGGAPEGAPGEMPPEGGAPGEEGPPPEGAPGAEGPPPEEGAVPGEGEETDADRRLPPPPRE